MQEAFPKRYPTEQVVVETTTFKGRQLVNARIQCREDEQGEWVYTKSGLTLAPELATQVGQAMLEAAQQIDGAPSDK